MTGAWRWSLVAPAGIGLVATVAPLLLYWSELPEPMAVHWSVDLRPDGSMTKGTALVPPVALIAGMLLVALLGSTRAYVVGRAVRVSLVTFVSALAATASTTIVLRNLGRNVWTEAGSLTPGLLALGGALLVQAAALQAALPQLRLRFVLVAALVVAAHAVELDPLAHSGWGYRGSLLLFGKASIVVRAGPALELDLTHKQRLFITVDDAATGARLLSALLEREPAAHGAAEANSG